MLIFSNQLNIIYDLKDVEPVFGFLKANLSFSRLFFVKGKSKVENALMAVNLRKYTAPNRENGNLLCNQLRKNGCVYHLPINTTIFVYLRLVMSQPLYVKILSKYSAKNGTKFCR